MALVPRATPKASSPLLQKLRHQLCDFGRRELGVRPRSIGVHLRKQRFNFLSKLRIVSIGRLALLQRVQLLLQRAPLRLFRREYAVNVL